MLRGSSVDLGLTLRHAWGRHRCSPGLPLLMGVVCTGWALNLPTRIFSAIFISSCFVLSSGNSLLVLLTWEAVIAPPAAPTHTIFTASWWLPARLTLR